MTDRLRKYVLPNIPYIRNIRKKLRLDCITTVKGIGYKFEMGQAI